MTTNDHNPTSPPWLQSHPDDTDVTTEHAALDERAEPSPDTSSEYAEAPEPTKPEATEQPGREPPLDEQPPSEEPGHYAGFPPAAGPVDYAAYPPAGSAHGPADGVPPPAASDPYGSYTTGQFVQSSRYQPEPYQSYPPGSGATTTPEDSGSNTVVPEPYPSTSGYGDYRQEIGPDGLVRRVPQDSVPAQPEPPQAESQGSPIYSWAPPVQPMYQQPPAPPVARPPVPPLGPSQAWHGGQTSQHHQQQPLQPQHVPQPGQAGHSINDLNLLKRARRAPRSGWRRAIHKASGGMINPGESAADIVYRDLVERVNQPVRGDYRIAILSLKGGVGKTTTTVGLGSTFSSLRGDRVIAIDANPDLGTLAHRVPRQTRSTVRNLLEDQYIARYSDVRAHTSQSPSRLEVLASEQDPAVSEAFSEADYRKAISLLQSFYNIILTDCGTGLMHSAMAGVLDMASSLVLVTSPAIDGARSASATLDWLDHHGYGSLVERTVVVVNASRRGASTVDLDQLRKLFLDRTRAVQVVPFDDHLAEGAEIDLELVSKPTRRALLELAAMVADDFGYVGTQQQYQPGYPGNY